jgi:hypothetical protein
MTKIGAAAAQTTTGQGGTTGNLAVIGEPTTHTQDANDASGQKKGTFLKDSVV